MNTTPTFDPSLNADGIETAMPLLSEAGGTLEPSADTRSPRRTLMLADGENIYSVLCNRWKAECLTQEQRPDWARIRTRLNGRLGMVMYLQSLGDGVLRYGEYLRRVGIRPIILEPETNEDGRRRKVVDEAIGMMFEYLLATDFDGDLFLASHDGDFMPYLERLNDSGKTGRRIGLIGLRECFHTVFQAADWLEKIDLDDDLKAISCPPPRPCRPVGVDQYDPAAEFDALFAPATPSSVAADCRAGK